MTGGAIAVAAALILLGGACPPSVTAHEGHAEGEPAVGPTVPAETRAGRPGVAAPAPGPERAGGPRLYEPPPPGTYALPPIERVKDHVLLGPDGKPAPLLGLGEGRATVVSFIYRSCTQATGCPLALATMQRLDRAIAGRADLARRVRLVTVSFDPAHDTPARMKALAGSLKPKCDWRFLTAKDRASLLPVLGDFGQDAVALIGESGEETGEIRHVLKVFLVDARGDIRNIYSTGFMDERLLLNDVLTVLAP